MTLTVQDKIDRRSWVGSSELGSLLGVNEYQTAWHVWASKKNLLEDWTGNEATKLGHTLEPAILDYAETELGILDRNVRIIHETLPLAAQLDGRTIDSLRPVEIKTTGLVGPVNHEFGEAGTDQIPQSYLVQVYGQLLCAGADLAYLFALIPGRGVIRYEVERNDAVLDKLSTFVAEWWDRHIVRNIEPSRDRVSLDIVKRVKRVPSKTISLGEVELSLVDHIERMKEIASDAQKRIKASEAQLLLALGDAEGGSLPDGRTVTYLEQVRKSYVVEESKYRVLRIKKG